MATNDPARATNDESLKNPKAGESDHDNEQISLEETENISGGVGSSGPS